MSMCGLLLGVFALFPQDASRLREQDARINADEARRKCANLVEGLDGVLSVGMGGAGTEYRLLVAVRDVQAKQAAQKALGGDTFEGLKVLWSIRSSAPAPVGAPIPAPAPPAASPVLPAPWAAGKTVATAAPSVYDCDIIRDHMKLRPISHPRGDGTSYEPCQLFKRIVEGGAVNPPPVLYAKHRPDCPVHLGRVSEPPVSDTFVAWVFRQGASVITPEGTPHVSDLRPGVTPPPTYSYPYPYYTNYGWYRPYYYRHYYHYYYPHYYCYRYRWY